MAAEIRVFQKQVFLQLNDVYLLSEGSEVRSLLRGVSHSLCKRIFYSISAVALLFSSARLRVAGSVNVAARLEKSYWLGPISYWCHGRTFEIRLEVLWQLELQQLIDLTIYNLLPCNIWLRALCSHGTQGACWTSKCQRREHLGRWLVI